MSVNERLVLDDELSGLQVPEGWYTPEEITESQKSGRREKQDRQTVINNLPIAAHIAEAVVAEIVHKTGIITQESYMRVAEDTSFHFAFLVTEEAFHAPEMIAAHLIAKEYTIAEERFDIHFSFSIVNEFSKRSLYNSDKYILKRVNNKETPILP